MICPKCGEYCHREEADVGVGIIYGPWGCICGWSEDSYFDSSEGPSQAQLDYEGKHVTSTGMVYGRSYFDDISNTLNERFGIDIDVADEILGKAKS